MFKMFKRNMELKKAEERIFSCLVAAREVGKCEGVNLVLDIMESMLEDEQYTSTLSEQDIAELKDCIAATKKDNLMFLENFLTQFIELASK